MKPTTHSHSKLFVHLVWSTKMRLDLLPAHVREILDNTLAQTAMKTDCTFIEWGGTRDHLHLLVRYRPDISVAELVRRIKSAMSHRIRESGHPEFEWQAGYGAYSVSEDGLESVAAYIRAQWDHHGDGE